MKTKLAGIATSAIPLLILACGILMITKSSPITKYAEVPVNGAMLTVGSGIVVCVIGLITLITFMDAAIIRAGNNQIIAQNEYIISQNKEIMAALGITDDTPESDPSAKPEAHPANQGA